MLISNVDWSSVTQFGTYAFTVAGHQGLEPSADAHTSMEHS